MLNTYDDTRQLSMFAEDMVRRRNGDNSSAMSIGVALGKGARNLVNSVVRWNKRRLVTAELQGLNDRLLADIGLVRSDINRVAHEWTRTYAPVRTARADKPLHTAEIKTFTPAQAAASSIVVANDDAAAKVA